MLKWLSVLATGCLLIFPLAAGSTAADGHTDQNGGSADEDDDIENLPDTLSLCVCMGVSVFVLVSVYLILFLQLYTFLIQLQIYC